jgi:hypothetical protein
MPEKLKTVNCLKCKQYYVTWDAKFPKGCKLFKFKSKSSPSILVFEATGAMCEHFEEKPVVRPPQ